MIQIKFKSNYLSMKLSFSFSILFLFHKYITTITINDIRAISIIDDYIYLIHIYKNSVHTIAMPGIYLLYIFIHNQKRCYKYKI